MSIYKSIGLDLGSKTCGVAVSDGLGMYAHPLVTLRFDGNLEDLKDMIQPILKEHNVNTIALGYPKMMNNDIGERALISEEFKALLETWFNIKVVLIDERLTSVLSERQLIAQDVSRKKRKKVVDQAAAVQILQSLLDRQRFF
ncbi:Holliday junction resolvase [Erysipelothrix larvae]|uniref:Putative pre-16S rRNA nuclease n=1 Tax=Erysipelothrix larvae TaxID=1514105 RepID=A0A109UH16_9FIRM|nr:Holliday junction resolvase RuvX [Erysipelothrix larvae]AMC93553.1 Holliday junction resolvase [Erysipelothrix larvae]